MALDSVAVTDPVALNTEPLKAVVLNSVAVADSVALDSSTELTDADAALLVNGAEMLPMEVKVDSEADWVENKDPVTTEALLVATEVSVEEKENVENGSEKVAVGEALSLNVPVGWDPLAEAE